MQLSLSLSAAVADALSSASLPATVAILPMHAFHPEELARPALCVMVSEVVRKAGIMATGKIILEYRTDPDSEPPATSATNLETAASYILSDTGRDALQTLLTDLSIRLRVLSPAGESAVIEEGRHLVFSVAMTFWVQTSLP